MSCGVTAVFASVEGRVQYRKDMNSPWQDAKVGDRISAGYRVRASLKASAKLQLISDQVKATANVAGGTAFLVPEEIASDGSYDTSAAVTQGRADFKVDEVGITNDFRVVAPSTSLAVRG